MDVQIIVPIGCSVMSAGCAVFVAWRASRWRESDEAKAIALRLDAVEKAAEKARDLPRLVDEQDTAITKLVGRVSTIEHDITELPTKADIRGLDEQLKGLAREQGLTHASVSRIENLFIQRGVGASV